MASITPLATVAFVLADTALSTDTGVFATLARSLTIATLLTFTASLATWFGRKVLVISTKLMLKIE
jgi:hypothetical protein